MVASFGLEMILALALGRGPAGVAFALVYLVAARYCWWRFRVNAPK